VTVPLKPNDALRQAQRVHEVHVAEREQLDVIRRYWKGVQKRPAAIPSGTPTEVRVMARSSRVNIMPIVVDTLTQSTFVDGFRGRGEADNAEVWRVWQANRMDARQTGIHRAAFGYGTAYGSVLPGRPEPVIRGASPRSMCCLYGEDPDWPMWALERLGNGLWRLFDDEAIYYVKLGDGGSGTDPEFIETREHGLGVCPVVRYLNQEDLDGDDDVVPADHGLGEERVPLRGEIAPLIPLQDQIDLTTFGLQIAQHYGAFRQRWIIGWTAESESELLKASAAKVWTFDRSADPNDPDGMKLGEFEQTQLDGFIASREATLRHAATLSQTPVHELTGQLVNMSAEGLAAAEMGNERKGGERRTNLGESHELLLWLCARAKGTETPEDAQVVWRDTSARSFAATVDGLGKLARMLNVPVQVLWERIPGFTQQDVDRARAIAESGDSFARLSKLLERQGP
jgi:hypothetical protein